jgi:hypothetical protein
MKKAKKRYFKLTPRAWKILRGDKTRYTWTIEAAAELKAWHGLDIEAELAALLTMHINNELLREQQ